MDAGNSVQFPDLIPPKTRKKSPKKQTKTQELLPSSRRCDDSLFSSRKMKTRNFDCCGATWHKTTFHRNWGRRLPSSCNINIPCDKKPGRSPWKSGGGKRWVGLDVEGFGGPFWVWERCLLQNCKMDNFLEDFDMFSSWEGGRQCIYT